MIATRSTAAPNSPPQSATGRRRAFRFLWSRAGTILGVAPLGVWTVVHLWHNLAAFSGAAAWQRAVTEYESPLSQGVIAFVVLAPLLFHSLWGLRRLADARPLAVRAPYYTNLKFVLQRISALGILAFLGAHLWLASIKPRWTSRHAEAFADIAHEMRFHTPTLVVYLLGTLGVSYHLANGLQTAGMKLGFGWTRRLGDPLEWPYLIVFLLLLAMSWGVIFALWRAAA